MNTEKNNVRPARIKYVLSIIFAPLSFLLIWTYVALGITSLYRMINADWEGTAEIMATIILMLVYIIILLLICILYGKLKKFFSYCTLRKIKKDTYCPVCGHSHTVYIRSKNPVYGLKNYRYIYRWCPGFERVVNVYNGEVIYANDLEEDYDRIYRKISMKKDKTGKENETVTGEEKNK